MSEASTRVAHDDDWDPLDAKWAGLDPNGEHGLWTELRDLQQTCPVAHSKTWGGFWMLSKYDDARRAAVDWQKFSSEANGAVVVPMDSIQNIPVEVDPPFHREVRRHLNRFFVPSYIDRLESDVERIINELIDDFADAGMCEFRAQFANLLPSLVFFELFLDLPRESIGQVFPVYEKLVTHPGLAPELMPQLIAWCESILETARTSPRGDGVLDAIVTQERAGRPISNGEQLGILYGLLGGALETVSATLGNVVHRLAVEPAVAEKMRAMSDLGPAVDEFLRLEGPAPGFGRTAMCDLSVRGKTIRKGERVVLYFGAANRDPDEFENPDQLDLDRTNSASHLSFGAGPHYCPGAPLARMELTLALRILLDRLSNIRLDPGGSVAWRAGITVSPASLPICFET
jgi:cytochrome P450